MASLSPSLSPSPEGGLGNIINAADCDYRLRTTDKELTDEQKDETEVWFWFAWGQMDGKDGPRQWQAEPLRNNRIKPHATWSAPFSGSL